MIKVMTDQQIKECTQCPLKFPYTRDCGKQIKVRGTSGSVTFSKIPDINCKVKVIKNV